MIKKTSLLKLIQKIYFEWKYMVIYLTIINDHKFYFKVIDNYRSHLNILNRINWCWLLEKFSKVLYKRK